MTMLNCWITLLALLSFTAGLSSSFAPALYTNHRRSLSGGGTKLFQSSIASASGADISSLKVQVIEVRKLDARNVYSPTNSSSSSSATTTAAPYPTTTGPGLDAEEQLSILRSKSIKELKLACSRRNIQYGKLSGTEEYVQAIWQDMEKNFAFSVTGLVPPGAMVELTGEQLDQEMTREESLILVDVYATWCGPCRVILPQIAMAAKKLMGDKVRVVKLDSDKHSSWAGRYQVQGLPTMLLIKEGRVVDRLEGAYMTNEIVDFVQQHIKVL